jgi:N-acetylmuramic acid 6-phosphate etherase
MPDEPLDRLTTEARNPASTDLDRLRSLDFVALACREDRRALDAVAGEAERIAAAIDRIAERMRRGGRLVYVGAGTSGRLGVLDAAECPPTFTAPPEQVIGRIAGGERALLRAVEGAEDDAELGAADLRALRIAADDSVVGITASGRTPYVLGALAHARAVGALTIALSCNAGSTVTAAAELAITPVVGPEILSGSTRLKAGTATKLVLNMLSTGVMVRLGKTWGNLMVDLQASNAKLRDRARRIVRDATGLADAAAAEALARCGGEVKTCIVHVLGGVGVETARARLAAAGGHVRAALEAHDRR